MPDNQDLDAVFIKPTVPKNSWQLLCWVIFEPSLLFQYSKTLNRKQIFVALLKSYFLIIIIITMIYLLGSILVISLKLPQLFPEWFRPEIIKNLSNAPSIFDSYIIYIVNNAAILLIFPFLFLTLFFALITKELIFGLVFELFIGLFFIQSFLPFGQLAIDFSIFGLIVGVVLGRNLNILLEDSEFKKLRIQNITLMVLSIGFAAITNDKGIYAGLGFFLACLIGYFHFVFYPFYYFFKMDFYRAPYLHDECIFFPIWRDKERLCDLALKIPVTALKFVTFLRTYRPLQSKLADNIFHAALAGFWLKNPMQTAILELPPLMIENASLRPSANWYKQADSVKSEFISYIQQNNISLKQRSCQQLITELTIFKQQTLVENRSWRDYYLKAIELWLKVAYEQLEQLRLQAKSHEPITANVYLSGEALNPEMHRAIFLGRDDVKEQFSRKVLTSPQMPMFLIQGQRRTGKTSLLNFLEPLLGAGFRVIKQDLQNSDLKSIPDWLADLQQRISPYLDTSQLTPTRSEDWLQNWKNVQSCLSLFNNNSHYKLILAFDEYEAIHTLLQQDPAQGERLLAAMRSFSQSQNKVVFLFVGAALFSELEQPNWSKYFVQAQRFRVDYLKHDDAIRLITEPVKLNYPPAVCEQMFDLTQGHPALLQLLCSKMVDIANTENKKDMSQADLDAVVQDVSNERETSAILIFWKDFCADQACKQTVKQILNGETIEPNQHLYHLEEHGFIVEQNRRWQMRVPLFTLWLKRFAERVL